MIFDLVENLPNSAEELAFWINNRLKRPIHISNKQVSIPEQYRDDFAQDVLEKLTSRHDIIVLRICMANPNAEKADLENIMTSYIEKMIINLWRSFTKKEANQRKIPDMGYTVPDPEQLLTIKRAFNNLLDTNSIRAESWEKSMTEIIALNSGEISMETLIDEKCKKNESRVTVRDRIYKQHSRLRQRLRQIIEEHDLVYR